MATVKFIIKVGEYWAFFETGKIDPKEKPANHQPQRSKLTQLALLVTHSWERQTENNSANPYSPPTKINLVTNEASTLRGNRQHRNESPREHRK